MDRLWASMSKVAALQAAAALGDAQLERGGGVPYTTALLDRITGQAVKSLHGGQPIEPDAQP